MQAALIQTKERLGGRVRALRLERGWSQARAAEEMGIHPKYLSRLENADANAALGVLVGVALAFETTVSALLAP